MATILSAGMMLDWLGDRHGDETAVKAGAMVEQAVAKVLSDGNVRTPDIGGSSSTTQVAEAGSNSRRDIQY